MEQGTINGYAFSIFGITISTGMASFLAFPKRKDSVENNWQEEDGIDKDLADPHFAARDFTLNVNLAADSRADFKTKYYGLYNELKSSGTIELYLADLDETYYLFYKDQQNFKKLKRKIDGPFVRVSFELLFGEISPEDNIDDTYIVTDQDEYIIA